MKIPNILTNNVREGRVLLNSSNVYVYNMAF
jgi:hypothetical protein